MKICKSIKEVRQFLKESNESSSPIGFVPTMGCLHEGHLSLVRRSKEENSKTIVSIFVNPLQFVQGEDYDCYPRTQTEDLTLLRGVEVDMVFIPENGLIYPNGKILELSEKKLSSQLCGMHRPGHFDGVLQVVLKLLNIVQCDRLYLGEKDYQQWMLIDLMVKELFLNLQVIACPVVREKDGLAMSSRNRYLSDSEKIGRAHV